MGYCKIYFCNHLCRKKNKRPDQQLYVPRSRRQVKSSEFEVSSHPKTSSKTAGKASNSQEAHEAIRPTDVTFKAEELSLSQDHKKLYNLICSRFVASQMPQPEIIVNSIKAKKETNMFETSVSRISFDGFSLFAYTYSTLQNYGVYKDQKDTSQPYTTF